MKGVKKNIAIFASGGGSNAVKIMEYFEENEVAHVALVVSNKADAPVLEKAAAFRVSTHVINRKDFYETQTLLNVLDEYKVDFIALAGFLWLVPEYLIQAYDSKIVNIHPALLPKYGGKGMYGHFVHEAVSEAGEIESGITIHWADKHYDEGGIIFQANCAIRPHEDPIVIAKEVLKLEHAHYAKVIEQVLI